jgi:hypothetical protein
MNRRMAEHVGSFSLQQATPPSDGNGKLLVGTADGKAVPMRRPLDEHMRRGPRRGKEKCEPETNGLRGAVDTICGLPTRGEESAGTNGYAVDRHRRPGHAALTRHLPQRLLEQLRGLLR